MNLYLYTIAFTIFLIADITSNVYFSAYSFSYDEQCAERLFDDYLKDAEPEFDKYMDKANDLYESSNPQSESEINDYIEDLNPLAEDYIDDLEPHAQNYIDNLDSCMN
jgi:hypothetical protein